jgi:hypothetical protein
LNVKFNKRKEINLYLPQQFLYMKNVILIFSFLFLSQIQSLRAQEIVSDTIKGTKATNVDPKQKRTYKTVKLKDGSFYTGYILEDNPREILMDIDGLGKMYIPKYSVKSIDTYDAAKIENGEVKEERLTNRNYMFNRSALPFDEKKISIDLPNFFLVEVSYAFNKNFRVGIFSGPFGLPLGVNLGVSKEISKELYIGGDLNIGGVFYGNFGNNNTNEQPLLFNVKTKLTSGNIDRHLTATVGYWNFGVNTFSSGTAQNDNVGLLSLAFCGSSRVSKNFSVLGEVNFLQSVNSGTNNPLITLNPAIRYHSGKRGSFVFGFNTIIASNNVNGGSGRGTFVLPLPHIGANFLLQ